jgi:hypothetical protein
MKQVEFLDAGKLLLVGRKVSFGALQVVLSNLCHDCCVAVGTMVNSHMELMADATTPVLWTEKHRIIVLRRRFNYRALE